MRPGVLNRAVRTLGYRPEAGRVRESDAAAPPDSVPEAPAARARPRRMLLLGKAVFSAALVYWIVQRTPLHEVGEAMRRADLALLLLALASCFFGYFLNAMRWRALLRAQGGDAGLPRLIGAFMSAIFFNNLLPSTIGGDALRMYESWRILGCKAGAVAVIVVDRSAGLLSVLLFALVALLALGRVIGPNAPLLYAIVLIGVAGLLGALTVAIYPPWPLTGLLARIRGLLPARLAEMQDRTLGAFAAFRGRQGSLAQALGLSIVLQANVVVCFYIVALALHLHVPFHAFFLVVPLASLIMMIPISINGIGLREHAFAGLLGLYGVSQPGGLAFAWVAYGLLVIQGVAGGLVYVLRRSGRSTANA